MAHFLTWQNRVIMVRAASGGGRAAIAASRECRKHERRRARKWQPRQPAYRRSRSFRELQRLGEGLGHARERAGQPADGSDEDRATTASGYAKGFRLSSELVAGVVVGAGLGWIIDRLLGISPWGLIVFLLLGFAAGVLNVMRSAGVVTGGMPDDGPSGKRED